MISLINRVWVENSNQEDVRLRYDILKFSITEFDSFYFIKLAKENRRKESSIIEILETLDKKWSTTLTENELAEYIKYRYKLKNIAKHKANRERIRARLDSIEEKGKKLIVIYGKTKYIYERKTVTSLKS